MPFHKNRILTEGGWMKRKKNKIAAIPERGHFENLQSEQDKLDVEFGRKARGGQYFKRLPASELIKPENRFHRKRIRRQEKLFGITTLT